MTPTPSTRAAEALLEAGFIGEIDAKSDVHLVAAIIEREIQPLLELLDKADDLLATGYVILNGWEAAEAWHAQYEKLPPSSPSTGKESV
jgi:hypothetical protein